VIWKHVQSLFPHARHVLDYSHCTDSSIRWPRRTSAVSNDLVGHGLLSRLPRERVRVRGFCPTPWESLTPRPLPLGEGARGASDHAQEVA